MSVAMIKENQIQLHRSGIPQCARSEGQRSRSKGGFRIGNYEQGISNVEVMMSGDRHCFNSIANTLIPISRLKGKLANSLSLSFGGRRRELHPTVLWYQGLYP